MFGQSDPTPTWTYTGFQGSDNAGNVTITGSAGCSYAAHSENVGTYTDAITCGPGILTSANYDFATGTKGDLEITQANTGTVGANANSTYSEQSVNVTLSATVSNTSTSAAVDGSVTFQVKDGVTNVGSPVTDTSIVAGAASVTYALPAGTNVGSYSIVATYNPSANFTGSSDTKTLTVGTRATTTVAANANSTYSEQSVNVTLSATVSASYSTVNAGSVTFQVKDGATNVGSAVTDSTIVAGAASVTYALPAGTNVGSYTIVATYSPSSNFDGSSDSTKTLTVGTRATTTVAAGVSSAYGDPATLTATVSATDSTVNAGSVTFQVKQGATNVGSAVTDTTIVNGAASVSYPLPPTAIVGTYTIVATYNPSSNFTGSSDSSKILTITPRNANVAYIGQTVFVSSGSSARPRR